MKKLFFIWIVSLICFFVVKPLSLIAFSDVLFEINTSIGLMSVCRPNQEEMSKTASFAKKIFVEAFTTTYTDYYRRSGAQEPIEKWLRLGSGLTLQSWLEQVFDDEYEEYVAGSKCFLYLCDSEGILVGWLSHSPISEKGEIYLSQCSLEAGSRNHGVATAAFDKVFKKKFIKQIFPEVKEIKLITRKINKIAYHLYTKIGFVVDETIDPVIYGDSYDDRYIGFRLTIQPI